MQVRRQRIATFIILVMFTSLFSGCFGESSSSEKEQLSGSDLWSDDYRNSVYPWGDPSNERTQFSAYHDYFTMKSRMMELAEQNPDILEYHEGLLGGINDRGEQRTIDDYEGWYYMHASPWLKITSDVQGGEYNEFVGDNGNYEDRPDVMLVGNHHAREWMSYEVPMFFLEVLVFSYNNIGYDNDGDCLSRDPDVQDSNGDRIKCGPGDIGIDEDGWDGIDNDGDCWSQENESQDSNGDGVPCGPGDLGVDEDFSEQWIVDLIQQREIYLIPMLNVDGNRYDREVFCGEDGWNCDKAGWRKNLRNNHPSGVSPIIDDEQIDEGCDGVDLNRNYEYEWGTPTQGTWPLIPGTCLDDNGFNNDVYNGPKDNRDDDGDGLIDEDGVDGNDEDQDGEVDEDKAGGNTEPETKFIQDMTEMNDDNGDGASDFKATLSWHSYSDLVLYPWGHCTDCPNPDQEQLKFHGDWMAQMTNYENMQSSSLYPTTGDFCDWHYGVHGSYCYTIEIGGSQHGFHPTPDMIGHTAQLNLGIPFYMTEIADNPRERAQINLSTIVLQIGEDINIPAEGDIPVDICIPTNSSSSAISLDSSVMKYRLSSAFRAQSDYSPKEWYNESWESVSLSYTSLDCLSNGFESGKVLRAMLPVPDDFSGIVYYKAELSTLDGADLLQYPDQGEHYSFDVEYRAPYGGVAGSLMLFLVVVVFVWGGLGICLRMMMDDEEAKEAILDAEFVEGS